jgi:CubicO group peptidase (beta-lactamase class C family)
VKLYLAIALTSLAAAVAAAQTAEPSRATLVAQLDAMARGTSGTGTAASLAVAVTHGPDTLLLRAYGLADQMAGRLATPHTIYEIGSLTKQVTAAAIMRLVDQRKISLDDDVAQYLPGIPFNGRHVTVRRLLNHTSGIHNYTNDPEWKRHWSEDVLPETVVGWVAPAMFDFAPGEKMAYSNTGYTLLGMIIEKVSGRTYGAFVQQELFGPLGLSETAYCQSHPTDAMVATGYTERNHQLVRADYLSLTIPYAAGAICSSVADFVRWELALHGGRVVTEESYTRMITPETLADGTRLNYGFGMTVGLLGGHPATMHGGEVNGFASAQVYLPKDAVAVVVLTNDDWATPQIVALDLARLVLGIPTTGRGALDRPQP